MKFLRLEKEEREGRKLPLRTISAETGLSVGAVQRALNNQVEDVKVQTIDRLCLYFDCKSIAELLDFTPEN